MFFFAPERCVSRDEALVDRLVELWEASVRATHDFLREEDIRGIRTYVPDALRSIADLRIVRDAEGVPVAFMGCDGRRLEMLFVDPACRGAGVGTALVREAFAAGVTEVVVNEQNPSARGFYEHVGFAVCGRSERDEQGGPFPILYMKLNDNNKPNMEKAIAKDLLSIGAVFLRPEQPFTWASGIKSPIYCDNRLTLTAPEVRKHVEAGLAEIVRTKFPEAEVLGVASIFTYGMQKGLDRLAAAGVVNYSLSNLDVLAEVAAEEGYIRPEDKARLIAFRNNPSDESWINK